MRIRLINLMLISMQICLLTTSCGAVNGREHHLDKAAATHLEATAVSTRSDIEYLFETFQVNGELGSGNSVKSIYQPEYVLPKISSYFVVGVTLEPFDSGGFKGYMLTAFPESVRNKIETATFGDDRNSGFALLQSKFWNRIGQLMDEGFKIGFVESDPKNSINGAFFAGEKMILIDSEANVGVLEHEYRHFLQSEALKRIEQQESGEAINAKCLQQASRYFAELDATTEEFHTWSDVFETFDVDPIQGRFCMDSKCEWLSKIVNGQMLSLSANLAYPQNALSWIDAGTCPSSLNSVLKQTARLISVDENEVANTTVGSLTSIRLSIEDDHFFLNTKCSKPELEQLRCDKVKSDLDKLVDLSADLKRQWRTYVIAETENRHLAIRKLLNALPSELHAVLCERASGFAFMSNCTGTRDAEGASK